MFDVGIALAALALLALPMLAIAMCIRLTSHGPAIFRQLRVGRRGRVFIIYKFRTMIEQIDGPDITTSFDSRITPFGRWLRRFKLDELPQFYNVLRGQMSLIGPRPTLSGQESIRNMPCRPGITGAATLAFRQQEEMLSRLYRGQLEPFYEQEIKPIKTSLDLHYMSQATMVTDIALLTLTLLACLSPGIRANGFAIRGLSTEAAGSTNQPI